MQALIVDASSCPYNSSSIAFVAQIERIKREPSMNYQVVTKTVSAQPLAAVRRRALSRDVSRIWKPARDLVWESLPRDQGLRADGHKCFLYHDPAHRDAGID